MVFAIIFLLVVAAFVGKLVYDVQKVNKRRKNQIDDFNVMENVNENVES